ncbi:hydantoinase B/oxoprolinase family protein [Bacillus sp. FJAT-29790]|uniref:hydantoinase B/oxoprolinase family protein n=1 Tax=Bacillus sp. FJAT-29790 TaxID=1895002 RepID=UPI001C242215|nr:hydantoinase B/oxoprolinase family protein [Bacillus sp. FJAT-29790]MBU8877526.1 hydantoinase B/oxoprolinase family protein [Bacillus sp. FJAT-29790]
MINQIQTSINKSRSDQEIDAITLEVVYSSLLSAADEMSGVLGRSAYSPIIREMIDYSCGIFDATGNLIAQAENIPAHLGSMGTALRDLFNDFPLDSFKPGDAYLVNDPYRGGQHTPDLHVFTPAFYEGELIGICGTIAHHADMGGKNPGTEGFDNRSIFEEGLRIPPVRLATADGINEAVTTIIAGNVREPKATMGDLRAQIAACRFGEGRLKELAKRYGISILTEVMKKSMDYSELRMRTELARMMDAETTVSGWLDDDGIGGAPVEIRVRVVKRGKEIEIDFTGTSEQMAGGMNVPPAAATSAVLYAIKCVVDPGTPQNQGCFRPIKVVLPEGSLVNPHFPAAVSLRHLAVQRIADTILRGLSELYPNRTAAGTFVGFSSLAIDSWHPVNKTPRVIQDDLGGGMGAHANGDGIDAVDTHCGNVAILPAEVCELSYQIRVRSTELIPDSGGPGQWRGGLGIRREYEILEQPHQGLVYTEQTNPNFAPWGLEGGGTGTAAKIRHVNSAGQEVEMCKGYFRALPGDRIIIETSGGGGYGDPNSRDLQLILKDIREGKVSIKAAESIYGAVVRGIL